MGVLVHLHIDVGALFFSEKGGTPVGGYAATRGVKNGPDLNDFFLFFTRCTSVQAQPPFCGYER